MSYVNFVETMALSRTFSVGRFRCSKVKPKINIAEYLTDGYTLEIPKNSTTKFCVGCIKDYFGNKKGLLVTENENYLSIKSF